ncbi:methyltransferase family protein [Planctomycetota bacterium]
MKAFLKKNIQTIINVYLFLHIGIWIGWQVYTSWKKGDLGYVEAAFAVQSTVMITMILFRRHHTAIEKKVFSQIVALTAFFSGLFFVGQPSTGNHIVLTAATIVTVTANILAIGCLFNLGRSFGILIALRKVKTKGLYGIVRHPMYGTDILLRIGFVVSHFNWFTVAVFAGSTGCYLYRAVLEEKFLSKKPEYREYMQHVKYRFIPGVF